MSEDWPPESELPEPGYPKVEWIDGHHLARWTFASSDENVQLSEFLHWCGWFGYHEDDRPEKVQGHVWVTRSSMNAPPRSDQIPAI